MIVFQLFASIFILFALWRIIQRYREKRLPKSEVVVWCCFWALISAAVWWPHGTDVLARAVGVSRGADLVFAASVALVFYLLFQLFSHVHQLQRDVTDLVRRLAIEAHEDERKEV